MNPLDPSLGFLRSTPLHGWTVIVSAIRWFIPLLMMVLGTLHLQAQSDTSVITNTASAVPTGVTFSINGLPKLRMWM